MMTRSITLFSLVALTPLAACSDDGGSRSDADTLNTSETHGNEAPTGDGDGDGDGDPTGDGDGDPTGDGDGDGDPTGDGDGAFCAHQCSADPDCLVGGQDTNLSCVDSFCTSDASTGCTDNTECVALFSGWTTPCTVAGGECDAAAQVCVNVGDEALCATPPSDFIDCATLGMEAIEVTGVDGNPVTVCARPTAECHPDNYCHLPCQSDGDCMSSAYPICDVATGVCGCGSDSDCASLGLPGSSVCNASASGIGICGCGTDQHCVEGATGDVCNGGFCGCSGDMACEGVTNSFDGGMIRCVEF